MQNYMMLQSLKMNLNDQFPSLQDIAGAEM